MYDTQRSIGVLGGANCGAMLGDARQMAEATERAKSPIEPPSNRSEVAAALEIQHKLVGALHDTISQLESRLQPVVAPMPAKPETSPDFPPCGTQVGGLITENAAGILRAIERLQVLMRAVQV